MTSAELPIHQPGKSPDWSSRGVPGCCGGGLSLLSPLTVVTAESASKQLRAVKSHWNVSQADTAFFL